MATAEQFGDLRDGNLPLVEQGLIDFPRSTIPNVGGITEFQKIAGVCETHYVGIVPHFTGPISEAAMVHGPFHGDMHAGNIWVLDDGRGCFLGCWVWPASFASAVRSMRLPRSATSTAADPACAFRARVTLIKMGSLAPTIATTARRR